MAENAAAPGMFVKIAPHLAAQMRRTEGDDAAARQSLRPLLAQMAEVKAAEAVADGMERGVAGKILNLR